MKMLRVADIGHQAAAEEAARSLQAGGIILYPTDTLYGLGVDIHNKRAMTALYALKQRDELRTPLIVVPSIFEIETYGKMNTVAKDMARRLLPGPLTLVLPATPSAPAGIIRDDGTVGVRMPNDPFCIALSAVYGSPYTSTSANISDMPVAPSVEAILQQFGEMVNNIDLVIDDGPRVGQKPSTIVSCVTETPQILRDGALSREELGIQ